MAVNYIDPLFYKMYAILTIFERHSSALQKLKFLIQFTVGGKSDVYSEPSQISEMELFATIVNVSKLITIATKLIHLGSESTSEGCPKVLACKIDPSLFVLLRT